MENEPIEPIIEQPIMEQPAVVETDPVSEESFVATPTLSVSPTAKPAMPKKFRLVLGLIAAGVVVVCFVALTAAVYLLPVNDTFVRSVASVVPYPIAVVNMHPITFGQFYKEWTAMQTYYQSSSDLAAQKPSDDVLATNLIGSMTNRVIIQQLASQYGLTLDTAKVDETYQSALQQSASEDAFLADIKTTFGWDKQEVIDKLIAPMVLASQVETAVQTDATLQTDALAKANAALARVKNGEDFATVATDTSDDTSAANGGDIGALTTDQLPPEWLDFFTANGLNVPSDVIDLGSVYSIAMATDQTEADEVTQYNVKAIIIYKKTMDEVVTSFESASKIWNFLKV